MNNSQPIFGKKRRTGRFFILLILSLCAASAALARFSATDPEEVIRSNQQKALSELLNIQNALERWKKADYDANGQEDYPVGDLKALHDTRMVNGRTVELISRALAETDLRLEKPKPLNGYTFTLTHPVNPWPQQGTSGRALIFARPAKTGVTGTCSFFLSSDGEAYYCDLPMEKGVPSWPTREAMKAGVWIPLDLDQLKTALSHEDP